MRSLAPEPLEVRALLAGVSVQLVKDINTVDAFPAHLTPAGDNLFYTARDSFSRGTDLMVARTDGTTERLHDFASDPFAGGDQLRTAVGDSVYFAVYDPVDRRQKLWTSDGTSYGTHEVSLWSTAGVSEVVNCADAVYVATDSEIWTVSPGGWTSLVATGLEYPWGLTPYTDAWTGESSVFFVNGDDNTLWSVYGSGYADEFS